LAGLDRARKRAIFTMLMVGGLRVTLPGREVPAIEWRRRTRGSGGKSPEAVLLLTAIAIEKRAEPGRGPMAL